MALFRYLASDILRSQRWIAAFILYAAGVGIINTAGGTLLGTYGAYVAFLLISTVWITVVALTCEDLTQEHITAVTVGGPSKLRFAKLAAAAAGCGIVVLASAAAPLALHDYSGNTRAGDVAAGALGLLLTVIAGCAIASVVTRPVIRKSGWAFLVTTAAVLADILVPGAPPTRQLLGRFSQDHPGHLMPFMAAVTLETVLVAALLVAGTAYIARRRD